MKHRFQLCFLCLLFILMFLSFRAAADDTEFLKLKPWLNDYFGEKIGNTIFQKFYPLWQTEIKKRKEDYIKIQQLKQEALVIVSEIEKLQQQLNGLGIITRGEFETREHFAQREQNAKVLKIKIEQNQEKLAQINKSLLGIDATEKISITFSLSDDLYFDTSNFELSKFDIDNLTFKGLYKPSGRKSLSSFYNEDAKPQKSWKGSVTFYGPSNVKMSSDLIPIFEVLCSTPEEGKIFKQKFEADELQISLPCDFSITFTQNVYKHLDSYSPEERTIDANAVTENIAEAAFLIALGMIAEKVSPGRGRDLVENYDYNPRSSTKVVKPASSKYSLYFGSSISIDVKLNSHNVRIKATAVRDNDKKLVFISQDVPLKLQKIQAGSFTMGCPSYWLGIFSNPRKSRVHCILTDDFLIGKYEITQKQFVAVMGYNNSETKGDDYPVSNVSWYEAKEFCQKLTKLCEKQLPHGYKFDLPTAAQWEYACKAGTTTLYYSGEEIKNYQGYIDHDATAKILEPICWFSRNSGYVVHKVGEKKSNAWGLCDMAGNVAEWCLDWYGDFNGDCTNWKGPNDGTHKVTHGGDFTEAGDFWDLASHCHDRVLPSTRSRTIGFRVVVVKQ